MQSIICQMYFSLKKFFLANIITKHSEPYIVIQITDDTIYKWHKLYVSLHHMLVLVINDESTRTDCACTWQFK